MKIGIVGFGFVGKAAYNGFSKKLDPPNFGLYVYDPFIPADEIAEWALQHCCQDPVVCPDLIPMANQCDFIFICVNTPTDFKKGKQDVSIVQSVVNEICAEARQGAHRPDIIIKSTARPGTTQDLQDANPQFNILFNPEFLVEKTFLQDFLDQDRIVLGGRGSENVAKLYKLGWPDARYHLFKDATSAELVKYGANAFLAAKISFFNEVFFLAAALGIGYTEVAEAICGDQRIGDWGSIVPGPDGQHGWGGKCFPKDLITLLDLQKELCVPNSVCRGTWLTNEHVREIQEWHDITGATTEKAYGSEDLDE